MSRQKGSKPRRRCACALRTVSQARWLKEEKIEAEARLQEAGDHGHPHFKAPLPEDVEFVGLLLEGSALNVIDAIESSVLSLATIVIGPNAVSRSLPLGGKPASSAELLAEARLLMPGPAVEAHLPNPRARGRRSRRPSCPRPWVPHWHLERNSRIS